MTTPLTTLNMAVVAPIPRASVRITVRLKAGCRLNMRIAYRRSCPIPRRPNPAGAPGVMAAGTCACCSGAMYFASRFPSLNSASARRVASSSGASRPTPAPASGPRDAGRALRRSRSRGSARGAARTNEGAGVVPNHATLGVTRGCRGVRHFISCHAPHGLHECFPGLPLLGQDTAPLRRHFVQPATAFVGLLDPGALDPAALLEAIEQGVEGIDVKLQLAARPCLDQFAQVVPVPGSRVEQREDQQFRRSAFQLAVERARVDICHEQIVCRQTSPWVKVWQFLVKARRTPPWIRGRHLANHAQHQVRPLGSDS